MSLARKLSLLFALIAILPVLAVGSISYVSGRRAIEQQAVNHLFATNILKEAELDTWLRNKARLMGILASLDFFRDKFAGALASEDSDSPTRVVVEGVIEADYLKPFLAGGGFQEIFIMEPATGRVLLSTDPRQIGKSKAEQLFFQRGRLGAYIQNVYYSMALQQPALTVSAPLRDSRGDLVAVIAGRVNLVELSDIIGRQSSLLSSEDTYLVNKFNFFITEPKFGSGFALKKSVNTEGVRKALERSEGFGFYKDYRGEPVIGAYKWLPEWELGIITEIDQSEAFAPVERLRSTTILFGLGIALLAALVGLGFSRTIVRPINSLSVSARKLGQGDLDTEIKTSGKGEVGKLARSFDRMRSNLKESLVSRNELAKEAESRRKAMEALEQEKAFSEDVINSMPGVFYLFDEKLLFRRWNRAFEDVSGYSAEEFGRLSPLDLFEGEDRERIAERIMAVFTAGVSDAEAHLLTKGGEKIPHYFTGSLTQIGGESYIVGMGIDISARKMAESARDKDRRRLLATLDGIDDVIYVADPESHELLHANETMRATWGGGAIGRKCHEVLQGRDTPCPFCTNDKILGEYLGRPYVWEFKNEKNARWYRCSDKAIQWVDGRMVRFEIATDITELKSAQEDLRKMNEDLSRSNQELEQFAYVASHDLQEPLRMVASYTQLLAQRYEDKLDEKAKKYIGYAVEGATRMQGLVNDLLQLSRVGTQGKPLVETDAARSLEEVLESLGRVLQESGVEIERGSLPKVMADPTQLRQLLQNLIENAVKFRGGEAPRVRVSADKNGGEWVFEVADNGIGIEPKYHERVFTIFQRLHERGRYPGSGIGLSIAKKIVERHGGRIWIESAPGEGTSFFFSLPGV